MQMKGPVLLGVSGLVALASAAWASDELDVLVLDDGGDNTPDLVTALETAGHTVTLSSDTGVLEYDFTGSLDGEAVTAFDSVIWLDGGDAYTENMVNGGQAALDGFVSMGGGLVLLGAHSAAVDEGLNGIASDLILFEASDYRASTFTYTVDDASHPVCEAYTSGDSFDLEAASVVVEADLGAWTPMSVAIDATGTSALSTGSYDQGRVAQFSWFGTHPDDPTYDLDYTDENVETLMLAALQYVTLRAPGVEAGSYVVAAESTVEVTVSATDYDGGDVQCIWDVDGNGFDEDTGLTSTFDAAGYDGPYVETLRVQCTDDESEVTIGTATVDIENVDPEIGKITTSGTLNEGDLNRFSATVSDIEGDSVTRAWDFGDGDTATGASPGHTYADDGTYTVTLLATDDDGGTDELSVDVTIANLPPALAASRSPSGRLVEGEEATFAVVVDDVAADTHTYAWDFGDGSTSTDAGPSHTYTQEGTVSASVTVTDDDGDSDSDTLSIEVVNTAPEVEVAGDESGLQGDLLGWTCTATDPGDDTLTYTWDFGDGNTGSGSATSHEYTSVGAHTVACAVDDGTDSTSDTLDVVVGNAAPEIATLSVGGGEEGSSVSFYVDAEDPGGDTLSVSWDFGDGSGSTGTKTSHTYTDDGDFTVTVSVSDGTDTTEASDLAAVTNVAPSMAGSPEAVGYPGLAWSFAPTWSDPGAADVVTFTLDTATDASVDASTGEVGWTPSTDTEGTFAFVLTATDDDGGFDTLSWTVTVGGTDTDDDGMTDDWETLWGLDPEDASDAGEDPDADGKTNLDEFLSGSDPTVYGGPDAPVVVSPVDLEEVADPTPPMTVENATDGDGDALSYHFEVYADDAATKLVSSSSGVSEGSDGHTTWTPGTALDENGVYWWGASADDGWIRGDASELGSFFVNATEEAPEVPVIDRPWPGATLALDDATVDLLEPSDPDGDAVTMTLAVYDELYEAVAETTGIVAKEGVATVAMPGVDAAGTWCVQAWAADDHALVSAATDIVCALVVADNQAPSAPTFLEPVGGEEADTLSLTVVLEDGVDPEGAALRHTIELDSTATFDSEDHATTTVDADGSGETTWSLEADLAPSTTWYLRAWADDGLAQSEATVLSFDTPSGHAAPGTPMPASPSHGQAVTAPVVFEAVATTDPDSDPLSYQVELATADGFALYAESPSLEADTAGLVSWDGPDLAPGSYAWRVQARDDYDQGPWSDYAYFFVDGNGDAQSTETVGCACGSGTLGGAWWLLVALGWLRRRDDG